MDEFTRKRAHVKSGAARENFRAPSRPYDREIDIEIYLTALFASHSRSTASDASRGSEEDARTLVEIIARRSAMVTLPFTFLYLNETP